MTTQAKVKLKPCPFCGCKRVSFTDYDGDMWATCWNCHAATGSCSTKSDCRKAWNTRTARTQPPGKR